MGTGAITQYVDVAQLVLYLFWIFFAGLIYYLARENHREGYPMETDGFSKASIGGWPVPGPKTFKLADGREVSVPNLLPDPHIYSAEPGHAYAGAPLVPVGNPLLAGVGPGAYARRSDVPDVDFLGHPRIVPLRTMSGFDVAGKEHRPARPAGRGRRRRGRRQGHRPVGRPLREHRPLPRDRGALADGTRHVLLPITFARVHRDRVAVKSVLGHQFAGVPGSASPTR